MTTAFRTNWDVKLREILKEREKFERERLEKLNGRKYRPFFGVRVSEDHGETWKLHALCDECKASIEPPKRMKNEGSTGAFNCDWCPAVNEMYREKNEKFDEDSGRILCGKYMKGLDNDIKMLSLWQPWASLCVWKNPKDGKAEKQIETRHWSTKYRGLLAIHAAKKWDQEILSDIAANTVICKTICDYYLTESFQEIGNIIPRGAIVGVVELIDCIQFSAENRHKFTGYPKREWSFGNFETGRYGWILKNPILFKEPIVCRGAQGLVNVPEEVKAQVLELI